MKQTLLWRTYAADARAATPSMAAELAVQDQGWSCLARLEALRRQFGSSFQSSMEYLLSEAAQLLGTPAHAPNGAAIPCSAWRQQEHAPGQR